MKLIFDNLEMAENCVAEYIHDNLSDMFLGKDGFTELHMKMCEKILPIN